MYVALHVSPPVKETAGFGLDKTKQILFDTATLFHNIDTGNSQHRDNQVETGTNFKSEKIKKKRKDSTASVQFSRVTTSLNGLLKRNGGIAGSSTFSRRCNASPSSSRRVSHLHRLSPRSEPVKMRAEGIFRGAITSGAHGCNFSSRRGRSRRARRVSKKPGRWGCTFPVYHPRRARRSSRLTVIETERN